MSRECRCSAADVAGARNRFVVLGMPGYGDLSAAASRGFWRATRLPDPQVHRQYVEGSLLANNFNQLWCEALNLAHQGRRLDYFAMQHSDIGPEDWWLDTLIDEMEANDLDVLGVVAPIKDRRGVTSIALARPDGDPWRPLCRLTMTDVYRLPETFTSEDVGHPILLNTGLWVCRFDEAWARKVWFTINDRIGFDEKADRYRPLNESEDWFFGRLCHELNLRVGCTRKVKLMHRGPAEFGNDRAWGECSWDAASMSASPLPMHPDPGRYVLPEITGWLRHEEGAALAELARGKRVLEVGSYLGLSTVTMARTAEHVVSVDTHDGRGTNTPADTQHIMTANLGRYGVAERVHCIRGTLDEASAAGTFDAFPPFDLAYIDGDHSREAVESDIRHALPLLAPGGLIAFHDYRSVDPGVTEAADALLDAGGELLSLAGSLAVVRPPASVPSSPNLLEV